MIVDVRMGDRGRIVGSSILLRELIDGVFRRSGEWLFSSDVISGGKICFPSNLIRGESIVGDNWDNWDGDIGNGDISDGGIGTASSSRIRKRESQHPSFTRMTENR